jgi:histidine ammonia-lyase
MDGSHDRFGLPCLRARDYLTRLVTRITALASFALDGNAHHFDATLFQ